MPMKTRSAKPHPVHRLRGTMTNASKLRNPYAKGRRIPSRRSPKDPDPIAIVDRTAEHLEPPLLVLAREPMLSGDRWGKHTILYRCRYHGGREDAELHEREIYAATAAAALQGLQRGMIGFYVTAVEIYAIRPPLTREQVAEIQAANEALDQERQRLGIYGEGEQRQKAIEQWLCSAQSARGLKDRE